MPKLQAFDRDTELYRGGRTDPAASRDNNVAITGCRENCTQTESQDVAMTPVFA
jgi:hypothetical protein